MATVAEHYDSLLAAHYSWMNGVSFADKMSGQKAVLESAVADAPRGIAVDLGCGPGYQSVALAQLGFSPVIAVDSSADLLRELQGNAAGCGASVRPLTADLRTLPKLVAPGTIAVAVCMGDTLTHLDSKDDALRLFRDVWQALEGGGTFVISYRDLTEELTRLDRFIPVRSDQEKIMTCFLEYESPDYVVVHDLIHIREAWGWRLEKSCYRKLRLGLDWMAEALFTAGFQVESHKLPSGLILMLARKS